MAFGEIFVSDLCSKQPCTCTMSVRVLFMKSNTMEFWQNLRTLIFGDEEAEFY